MLKKLVWLFLILLLVNAVFAQETARSSAPDPAQFTLLPLIDGLDRPLYLTHAGDGSGRRFILEQSGRIWVLGGGEPQIFLDLQALVSQDVFRGTYTERGLLGLAFHPNFAENGLFFVNYTDLNGDTVVARYSISAADAETADPASAEILLTVAQPYPNHNGGHMAFGPDGYLYISMGDGGAAGDPENRAQNLETLLGKLLRIDVDSGSPYGIPADNPFANGGGLLEIWASGLRNVWRFSFDRATGDLYLGDVGQNAWEEINFQAAGAAGGQNYGWRPYEASYRYSGETAPENMTLPVLEYPHSQGCSVTTGYVYRGAALPDMDGVLVYGDFCSGIVWGAYRDTAGAWQSLILFDSDYSISSFGEDEAGELYLLDHSGTIYQFVPAS